MALKVAVYHVLELNLPCEGDIALRMAYMYDDFIYGLGFDCNHARNNFLSFQCLLLIDHSGLDGYPSSSSKSL